MIFENFKEGIERIWKDDYSSQEHYISIIGKETRGLDFEIFKKFNAFFVPNDEYIIQFFGKNCIEPQYGLYDLNGMCILNNCIVFPCYTLSGRIIAWASFNPFIRLKAIETGDFSKSYYNYPSKFIFNKKKYLFILPEIYKKALKDEYIILTDGIFDTVSFVNYGLNAASLLGSYLNTDIAFYLRFIPKVFVSVDNDDAGIRMLAGVRKLIPHAKAIKQGAYKDSDDILKTQARERYISEILRGISQYTDVTLKLNILS